MIMHIIGPVIGAAIAIEVAGIGDVSAWFYVIMLPIFILLATIRLKN
jgi:hypothetical protein